MVRKIEQFQKLRNYASDSLSPYSKQELFGQFPLWEECLNACPARLYAKTREEEGIEVHSWREHPFDSYACFIKDHKKICYSVRVLDIDRNGMAEKILDLVLVQAGEYRIESLRGKETICFASDKYLIGVSPDDTDTENEHFRDNVLNAIGNWWYLTRRHSWKDINLAVEKMKKKSMGKQVPTVNADPTPVPRRSQPSVVTEDHPPPVTGDVPVVYVRRPPEVGPHVKILPYEVQEHRANILDVVDNEVMEREESTTMVLVTANTVIPEAEAKTSVLSAITDSDSTDSITWSDNLVTPHSSLQEAEKQVRSSLQENEKQLRSALQEGEKRTRSSLQEVQKQARSSQHEAGKQARSPGRTLSYKAEEVATTVYYSSGQE